jgi:nucleotide-binding universal stress UspA family protein
MDYKFVQMKKIIVPTDFSKCSGKALDYAVNMAKILDARIVLLHAFQNTFIPPEVPYEYTAEKILEEERNIVDKLKSLAVKITLKHNVRCSFLFRQGSAVDIILDTTEIEKADWIIMGTKGASGIKEIIIGSITEKIIENTICPVIAVPEKAAIGNLNKIVYATDYHLNDLMSLRNLVKIAKAFRAEVDVVHVTDGEYLLKTENELLSDFKKNIGGKITYKNISYQLAFGNSVDQALEKFVKGRKADLLAVSTHNRNIFDKLFGTSIVKALVYHSKIPLLAFHYRKDPIIFT